LARVAEEGLVDDVERLRVGHELARELRERRREGEDGVDEADGRHVGDGTPQPGFILVAVDEARYAVSQSRRACRISFASSCASSPSRRPTMPSMPPARNVQASASALRPACRTPCSWPRRITPATKSCTSRM